MYSGGNVSIEDTIRQVIQEEFRALREELGARRPAPAGPELLTLAQAAANTGLGVSTIRKWLDEGKLNRYGDTPRNLRVSRDEIARLMAPKPRADKKLTDADIDAKAAKILERFR